MSWTNAWDETHPSDSDIANTLGSQGRDLKLDIRQRLNDQHIWGVGQTVDGGHRNINIPEAYANPNMALFAGSGYSLTGSAAQSMIDLHGTWNTSGDPTAVKVNVIDTASGSSAKLLDLQVGGVSKFSVDKDGNLLAGSVGFALHTTTQGVDYTPLPSDDIVITFNTKVIYLDTAVGRQRPFYIKNGGTGVTTVVSTGGEYLDYPATSFVLYPGDSITVVSDNTNWWII